MTPLQLLERELNILLKSRRKSFEAFDDNRINSKLHKTHLNNLNPMIKEFENAINKLKE